MDSVLQARTLSKSFGALRACDGVDLDLRTGEIHALIGPNGAGKSTLIKLLAGSLTPDTGSVHIDGTDVTREGVAARARRGIARTFQVSALAMEDTVLQNALLGAIGARRSAFRFLRPALRDEQARMTAEAALARVGLSDAARTPVAQLSHGQRRQLEVAVALAQSPRAFVMDEPMAGLGETGSAEMTALLDGLRHEAPILLVEHDMRAVFALADRISVLVAGAVIASGTPTEIRADEAVRRAYLGEEA